MLHEKFVQLVEKYTEISRKHPTLYRLQVLTVALFGYFYIYFILLLSLLLIFLILASLASGHAAALKFLVILIALTYAIIRALWIKFEKPSGLKITVNDAPKLFHELEELKGRLKSPKIHEVLVNTTYNAGISQIPRFGFFGGYRNYLILGLPYLGAMTHEEFKSVLAHELGHLNRAHGRLGSWIYRIRTSWFNLVGKLENEKHWALFLFRPFFKRYIPYFDALTVVMSRAQEFEADRLATQIAGAENNASSLLASSLKHRTLETHFWPEINELYAKTPTPIPNLYSLMFEKLKEPIPTADAEQWIKEELSLKTRISDSHPSLSERLEDIGSIPPAPQVPTPSAAEFYFVDRLNSLLEHFNTGWQESVREDWEQHFEDNENKKRKLAELSLKAETEQLSPQETFDLATLHETFGNEEKALEYYRLVYQEHPNDPLINYYLGHALLEIEDETGITLLEKAMELDPEATENSCRFIYDYLHRTGKPAEAEKYYERAVQYRIETSTTEEERNQLTLKDEFSPHSLTPEELQTLIQELKKYPVRHAYLVKKETTTHKDRPLYGLFLEVTLPWYKKLTKKDELKAKKELNNRLAHEISFPGETLIISHSMETRKFRRKFKKVKGSKLF